MKSRNNYTIRTLVQFSILSTISILGNSNAQTFAKFAPTGAIAAIEINDLIGARETAKTFIAQAQSLKVVDTIVEASNLSAVERKQAQSTINEFSALIEREGFVGVYVDLKKFEPQILLAARPSKNATAKVNAWLKTSLNDARKAKSKIITSKAGGFPIFTIRPRGGGESMSIGFQGGIAYAATSVTPLASFLKRVAGDKTPGLAASSVYKNTMDGTGTGILRTYTDLSTLAGIARTAAKQFGSALPKIQLEPIFKALTTLGRLGGALKLNSDGIEQTTLFAPDIRGGDDTLYKLLTAQRNIELKAVNLVPANALTFSTGTSDASAWYSYISSLVDRTKLNPGGLDPLLRKELGLDFRKVALSWMTGEFASATFATDSSPNASNTTGLLGETVLYISTNDEEAARNSLEAILPRLVEQGNKVANKKLLDYRPSKAKIAGADVTRFPIAQGISFAVTTRNGFLILASSDDALISALGAGPRLTESAAFKSAIARVPAGATGYSYTNLPAALTASSDSIGLGIQTALSLGLDLKPSVAKKLGTSLQKLLGFTAERVGPQINWSEITPNGIRSVNFTPLKW